MTKTPPTLQLARCVCGAHSFPANRWGCHACGAAADTLQSVPCPEAPRLRNFITVHAELAPGVPPPCVIGEVELAPGVIEEAVIDVADESMLRLGMALRAVAEFNDAGEVQRWRFRPLAEAFSS